MHFTEKMVYNTIWIGDLVEQSVRYTNLEQFVSNQENDLMKCEEYEKNHKIDQKMFHPLIRSTSRKYLTG